MLKLSLMLLILRCPSSLDSKSQTVMFITNQKSRNVTGLPQAFNLTIT